jgi:plasmid stabilization system protein ParE
MQQYTIKMSDLAEEDLENAGDYIAFKLLNPSAAENTVKGIRTQVNKLEYFPESHELDDDSVLAELGVHKTYYKEYKIFFVIDHELCEVYIIRILHMRVDSRAWLYCTLGITK